MQFSGAGLIDLAEYPTHCESPERDAILSSVRASLARDGCAVLKGFLTPDGIAALTKEADGVADKGHKSFSQTNA